MVSAITVNPEYKSLAELPSWQEENDVKVYEFTYFTPELIWAYGDIIEVLQKEGTIKIPSETEFAILVSEEETEKFTNTFTGFSIEKVSRYDMNAKGKDDRSHKLRLYRDLYLVTKR